MRYDDASWHVSEDSDGEINPFAGATHVGMFLAWTASRNLLGDLHTQEFPEDLERLRSRLITPGAWFTDEDLNEEGNLFAQSYYADGEGGKPAPYFLDYVDAFPDADPIYQVPDNWETFEQIAPIIDRRFNAWKKQAGKSSGLLGALGLSWLKSKKQ